MKPLTVLIVEPCVAEARFIEDAIHEAMETGVAAQALRPVHLEELDDALIVVAEEKVEAVVLGTTPAPLRAVERIAERAPDVAVIVVVDADERRTGVAALRRGAQDYLVRGELDYIPLARAIEKAIERQKVVQSWRAVAMRDAQTGLLSAAAFSALRERGAVSSVLLAGWEPGKLDATEAATAWIDAVGHDALPARIAHDRFAALPPDGGPDADAIRASLAAATGAGWSVTVVSAADLMRE